MGSILKFSYRKAVRQAILKTLLSEAVDMPCAVSVLITNDTGIRSYNRVYRDTVKATDVLSFPMLNFNKPGWYGRDCAEIDRDTGMLPLGDIIISAQRVKKQALARGHSPLRETAHLAIHSTLHLLGYDHDGKAGERIMRRKEKFILRQSGYLSQRKGCK